jgi:hypothetical protein
MRCRTSLFPSGTPDSRRESMRSVNERAELTREKAISYRRLVYAARPCFWPSIVNRSAVRAGDRCLLFWKERWLKRVVLSERKGKAEQTQRRAFHEAASAARSPQSALEAVAGRRDTAARQQRMELSSSRARPLRSSDSALAYSTRFRICAAGQASAWSRVLTRKLRRPLSIYRREISRKSGR